MWLLSGFAVWAVITAPAQVFSMLLNGANAIRFQAVTMSLMATAGLIVKVALTKAVGLPGTIWGAVLAYVALIVVPYAWYGRRLLASLKAEDEQSAVPLSAIG
jgi:hypothetical protein